MFTARKAPSPFYQSFVAGGIRLDVRELKPADVVAIAINPDRQEQQNVRKLAQLSLERWARLVDLINRDRYEASIAEISNILGLDPRGQQEVEALAARSNMNSIVNSLHDSGSTLMKMLFDSLAEGKLCIVDLSQMRGGAALILSGLILRKIFDHNQQQFTEADSRTIPTIAVVEEAQSVLSERSSSAEPYIAWVKEGRKYDLGAVLITQQPGSIPDAILSQGDNWFIFHLLSAYDLGRVQKANAHFSEDILSVLLNEPIPGHCVFWSSVKGKPYPISLRVLSFEKLYKVRDPLYCAPAAETFASVLLKKYERKAEALKHALADTTTGELTDALLFDGTAHAGQDATLDYKAAFDEVCRRIFLANNNLQARLSAEQGVPWAEIIRILSDGLAAKGIESPYQNVHQVVRSVLASALGPKDQAWEEFQRPSTDGTRPVWYVRRINS